MAKTYCTICHMETPARLLDRKTWVLDVLPQMGPRLGMFKYKQLPYPQIHPIHTSQHAVMTQEQWDNLVEYFHLSSPEKLPPQELPIIPEPECPQFVAESFSPDIDADAIFTMIEVDTLNEIIYAGEAVTSTLYKMNYQGDLLDTIPFNSAVTDMLIGRDYLEVAEVGILHPNNEDKGKLWYLGDVNTRRPISNTLLIDSIFRPVYVESNDYNNDGTKDYLVCEYGNDIGRLTIYYQDQREGFKPYIIENIPGSIVTRTHDFNRDGFLDIAVLFAQGDERIVIYYNDGKGDFRTGFKIAARFPAVYGSMYFDLHDFNEDGNMDILYVNGDNFDYSQILKPYHGIRILMNDGNDEFKEEYFYPIYGAGRAIIHDFDLDKDSDIVVVSNFADMENNPERGIIYLENRGDLNYQPYSIPEAAVNQWNTIGAGDFDRDGDMDVIVGSMNLANVTVMADVELGSGNNSEKTSLLLLRNTSK